jgi:hypothetical protein
MKLVWPWEVAQAKNLAEAGFDFKNAEINEDLV